MLLILNSHILVVGRNFLITMIATESMIATLQRFVKFKKCKRNKQINKNIKKINDRASNW
jgi:hypothetical protein